MGKRKGAEARGRKEWAGGKWKEGRKGGEVICGKKRPAKSTEMVGKKLQIDIDAMEEEAYCQKFLNGLSASAFGSSLQCILNAETITQTTTTENR